MEKIDEMKEYRRWIANCDEENKHELEAIQNNPDEINERFCKTLKFETAGIRGVIGAGLNRMNRYIVAQATEGLARNMLKKDAGKNLTAVIAYDSRNKSYEFAKEAAIVLAANGIKVYLFDELRPVPILSFAVRFLHCDAGIVITASHNPAKYNGYKVYGADGAQMNPEDADDVLEEIEKIDIFVGVKRMDFGDAKSKGLIEIIGKNVDDAYISKIKKQRINPEITEKFGKNVKIVYTPFNGSGNKPVRRVLKEIGLENVIVVPEQENPDGNFPTVKFPNPEFIESFELAIKLAKKENAELIIGTDPDSDRIGIVVRDENGKYKAFTGNQTGVLLTEYILSQKTKKNCLPGDAFMVKTIVTTNLAKKIGESYGVKVCETLTGFKFIGELIKKAEKEKNGTYVFGFEESYGYLIGTHARDKDAVVAAMLISEMYIYYKNNGMSLFDKLNELYEKFGYYIESTDSLTIEGIHGLEQIDNIMENFRKNPPTEIGKKIIAIRDYKLRKRTDLKTGKTTKLTLPESNVLYFELEDDNTFIVRPSGTEPKIKFYSMCKGKTRGDAESMLKICKNYIEQIENENQPK
jgi:phosphoglucomutase